MNGKEKQLVIFYLFLMPSEFCGPFTCCSGHFFIYYYTFLRESIPTIHGKIPMELFIHSLPPLAIEVGA